MVIFLNQYFLLGNLFFFVLFLLFTFSLFHISPVISVGDYNAINSSKFFGISPEYYYDPSNYLEETSLPEQLDQESTTPSHYYR